MKILKTSVLLILLTASSISYAESIFLKDGSIIEGKIIKETDKAATIQLVTGAKEEIPRKDILRIIFESEYKNKIYIYKTNGDVIEGYIVNEDKDSYTYRTKLDSARETVIRKSVVDFISKSKLKEEKEKTKPERTVVFDRLLNFKLGYTSVISDSTTHPIPHWVPGFEFGYGFYDKNVEFELSISMAFGNNTDPNMFARFNMNFVFINYIGLGLGYSMYTDTSERGLNYPAMDFNQNGLLVGPILRIPNRLHVSLFMFIPISSGVNLGTAPEGINSESYYYTSSFNFNMILAVDVFVWKTLSVGLTYSLLGGEFSFKDGSQNPPYTKVRYYDHVIHLSVGYGFHL